jgi:hypothetical protein
VTVPTVLGAFLVGFGIMGVTWFIRKLFKPKGIQITKKALATRWVVLILGLIFVVSGWHFYSGFGKIPYGGLFLGLVLGIRVLINEHTGRWY